MITWWTMSLVASLFLAMYVYCNQIFKLSSHLLMMYRGIGVTIIMLPFMFSIGGHFSWLFYLLSAIQGLSIGFIDNRYFRSSKVFGAEITGALQPLSLVLTFVFWFILKPAQLFEHLSHPFNFALIILCLGAIITAIMLLRRAKLNKKATLYLLPCILLGGFNDTNSKLIMDIGSMTPFIAIYYYTMVSALFSGLYSLPIYIRRKHKFSIIFKKDNLIKGSIVMFILIGLVFFKAYALVLTPNPSYVVAICFMSTIWIYAANTLYTFFTKKKVRNKINFKILILLILSTIVLILVTRR